MTRQQEKVVLARLEALRKRKMAELNDERRARRAKIASAGARLADAVEKKQRVRDAVLGALLDELRNNWCAMRTLSMVMRALPEYDKLASQAKAEEDAISSEFAARENKLNAFADNLAVKLVLGNDADTVLALLDQFGSEKF